MSCLGASFPERSTQRAWPGPSPDPRAPFVAAFLIKLHEGKRFISDLRAFLTEHPALVFWLGFARVSDPSSPFGFDVAQTVHKRRHFSSVLRTLPNDSLQFLLSASIHLLQATLPAAEQASFGDTIALDTQALLAWVKQNNPKQFIAQQTAAAIIRDAADNLRQAWSWAVAHSAWDTIARSLPALRQYTWIDGLFYEQAARVAEAAFLERQEARAAAAAAAGDAVGYLQLSTAKVKPARVGRQLKIATTCSNRLCVVGRRTRPIMRSRSRPSTPPRITWC